MKKLTSEEIKGFVSETLFDERTILNSNSLWPRISIVTPSLNQGKFLERTILSVLNQNYPNLEYIIIDGGSEDGSTEVIKRYEKYLTYWVSEKDSGQSDAICKGFKKSTGEVLAWLNSDDLYMPGTLQYIGEVLKNERETEVVYGNRYVIDENDRLLSERRLTYYSPSMIRLGVFYGGFGVYQPASFWRRDIYEKVGGVNSSFKFCMDTDLFMKFALYGAHFKFLREYIVAFRAHSDSKTCTIRNVAKEELAVIIERYGLKHNLLRGRIISSCIRLIKALLYIIQGDGAYLYFKLFQDKVPWVP